jgi:hypothetical protein
MIVPPIGRVLDAGLHLQGTRGFVTGAKSALCHFDSLTTFVDDDVRGFFVSFNEHALKDAKTFEECSTLYSLSFLELEGIHSRMWLGHVIS